MVSQSSILQQFVVDANVVAKLYLRDEQYIKNADLLFARFSNGQLRLIAPNIISYEVPAIIVKGYRKAQLDEELFKKAVTSFRSLGIVIIDDSGAVSEAMNLALVNQCNYYDALYILLAQDLNCRLITADDRLCRNLKSKKQDGNIVPLWTYT